MKKDKTCMEPIFLDKNKLWSETLDSKFRQISTSYQLTLVEAIVLGFVCGIEACF